VPTTRHRRAHGRVAEFDEAMRLHLTDGDCLLAGPGAGCGCGVVGPDGAYRHDLAHAARDHFELRKGGKHVE
jgi:hypothetical protein